VSTTTSTLGCMNLCTTTPITPSTATTSLPVAPALLQPCRAPLVLVTRPRALRQPPRAPRLLVSGCTHST
jgi:hypothetical protein